MLLEKYSLTWHTYSDHLEDMMKEMMMNDDFADVTLVSEDKKHIKAHKIILSACSPVFKDIVKLEKNTNTFIFLKGINFSDLEPIMQFIYVGEATLNEEKLKDFLAVAKSMEIKGLGNAETEKNNRVEFSPSDPEDSMYDSAEETMRSSHLMNQASMEKREVDRVNGKYECDYPASQQHDLQKHEDAKDERLRKHECDQCHKTYASLGSLNIHRKSSHEGVKFACDQCDQQYNDSSNLKRHIRSKHEGIRYACVKCDYESTDSSTLNRHIKSKHEGVRYACNQCDFHATTQYGLKMHIEAKHEGN